MITTTWTKEAPNHTSTCIETELSDGTAKYTFSSERVIEDGGSPTVHKWNYSLTAEGPQIADARNVMWYFLTEQGYTTSES